jgi:hypothetical protein
MDPQAWESVTEFSRELLEILAMAEEIGANFLPMDWTFTPPRRPPR